MGDDREPSEDRDFAAIAASLAARSHTLRPRLSRAVGPCVYIRRDALELVGQLDEQLDLRSALESRLRPALRAHRPDPRSRRRRRSSSAWPSEERAEGELAPALRERYPYLAEHAARPTPACSPTRCKARASLPRASSVTLDARALDGAITGTHVHILELILALARTNALQLRLLVRAERIDRETREPARARCRDTELLAAEELDPATPRSTVFHRPQQTFSPSDVALALRARRALRAQPARPDRLPQPRLLRRRRDLGGLPRGEPPRAVGGRARRRLLRAHARRAARRRARRARRGSASCRRGSTTARAGEPPRPAALDDAGRRADAGFLLCLGTDFRHKNRVFALRLLRALRERHGWHGRLVLAGTHIAPGSSARARARLPGEHPELTRRGRLARARSSEREKAWLIANAGADRLPVGLRGLRAGAVRVGARRRAVPVRPAGLARRGARRAGTATIVPWDPDASAAAAYALLTDADARERARRARWPTRARALTWDAAAAAMVAIYREAALAPVRDSATLSRDLVKREARLSVQHDAEVRRLVGEREHAQRMYDELNAEVGFGPRPDRPQRRAARRRPACAARAHRAPRAEPAALRGRSPVFT